MFKTSQTFVICITKQTFFEEIIETMKAAGRLANKDYFTVANFDEQRGKLLLCELVFA